AGGTGRGHRTGRLEPAPVAGAHRRPPPAGAPPGRAAHTAAGAVGPARPGVPCVGRALGAVATPGCRHPGARSPGPPAQDGRPTSGGAALHWLPAAPPLAMNERPMHRTTTLLLLCGLRAACETAPRTGGQTLAQVIEVVRDRHAL